ncbi:MAG TPA: hypothetical protein VHZ54_17355 [Solirubrobacterales bacterium]|nr:hypothetical protein [Solirubrobacterales bacterium]
MRYRVVVPVLVALLVLALASVASAATTHNPEPFSPLTGSGSGLTLQEGNAAAFDEATGNVFVNDGGPGHERVAILGREGGPPVGLAAPYEIPGFEFGANSGAYGLAFDNSPTSPAQGTLYVNDPTTRGIKKYARNAVTERYELESAGELTIPNPGREIQLSVDGSGDLWVLSEQMVYEMTSTGTVLHEYALTFGGRNETPQGLAVDDAGDLFVVTNGGIFKFPAKGAGEIDPTNSTLLDTGFGSGAAYDPALNRVFAVFSDYVGEYNAETGELIDHFGEEVMGSGHGIAVDSINARVYVSEREASTGGHHDVDVFGPGVPIPSVAIGPATGVTGTKATLSGSVTPFGPKVTECFFEWGEEVNGEPHYGNKTPCEGEIGEESTAYTVTAAISGLLANGIIYDYRLAALNENGRERSATRTFETGTTVATEPATGLGPSAATLNGVVRPEGVQYTNCVFEYGLISNFEFEHTSACNPSAELIGPDFTAHPVSLALTGLESNSTYKFRVTATNAAGTLSGQTLIFTTSGPPQIGEVQASMAGPDAVSLQATINPSGFGTSYRFEWGSTSSYGNVAPAEFEPFIGSGTEAVLVKARITGLSAATVYHYRVVASSSRGVTESPDHIAETLNTCGLVEGRCFELVSPREAGPVAIPGEANSHIEMHYQAATSGPGGFAYPVETGFPDATKGADVLYRALRGSVGWESTQLSAPISAPNERLDNASVNSAIEWLSNDLSCGFIETISPLTSDPSMNLVREEGGSNLYRINPDNSYTPITVLPPQNGGGPDESGLFNYRVAWGSQNCDVTVFSSAYTYSGIPGTTSIYGARLYEWRNGTMRDAGVVPGPTGPVSVPALAGWEQPGNVGERDTQNSVSTDGSRIFITAERKTSPDPEEIGKQALFVREDGRETRDVSLSETSVPDEGAKYQWATADGSKVFFTANAGLTSESNSEGTDLYEYNLETEELADRTITQAAGGAQVLGALGLSADGSDVYFASRNQLVPGEGNSLAENVSADSYSIYREHGREIAFVGSVENRNLDAVLINRQPTWTAQVTPDGRYLTFESAARNTGYDNGNVNEVYLYDADTQETTCVTCRQDGQPSQDERYERPAYSLLMRGESIWNPTHPPQFLTERDGQAMVFFTSPDPLAPGAVAGQNNIYEWSHDQIFRLVSAPEGTQVNPYGGLVAAFGGASESGSDVYLITPETLSWEDGDERLSAYDARIGGGNPEPPPTPGPCQATAEDSCQAPAQPGAVTPGPATSGDSGAQNFETKKKSAPKKKSKKQNKKNMKKSKNNKKKHKKKSKNKKRQANSNRRNGK